MGLLKNKKNIFIKVINSNLDIMIGISAVLFFVLFFSSVMLNINPTEGDVPSFEKLTENDLIEYNNKNNSIKKEMKKYFESNQLNTMEESKNRVDLNVYYKRLGNPFEKSY